MFIGLAARNKFLQIILAYSHPFFFYIVDSNDASFSQQLQRLFKVAVIVNFVCIDEDKVKCSSLVSSKEVVWKKQEDKEKDKQI